MFTIGGQGLTKLSYSGFEHVQPDAAGLQAFQALPSRCPGIHTDMQILYVTATIREKQAELWSQNLMVSMMPLVATC